MIARLAVLLRKEVAQHLGVFLGAAVILLLIGATRWIIQRDDPLATSDLSAASTVVLLFVPLLGLVLGHRMVVREYQLHTQLFLEALPLRRAEMLLGKFGLGLLALGALSVGFVLAFSLLAGERSVTFLVVLCLRTSGYVLATWSIFFSFGLLGRMRVAAYATLAVGVVLLDASTGFELARFGPIALIDPDTFPYERSRLPYRALAESALMSAALVTFGTAIALVHEGSIAERLSRRASPREVVAVTVLIFAEIMLASWVQQKQGLAPFQFTSTAVYASPRGVAQVMYGWPTLEPRAVVLGNALDELGSKLERELGASGAPPLRVAHDLLLTGREIREQHRSDSTGVLLSANLGSPTFEMGRLLQTAAHSSLVKLSRGRASFEPNHWLLDGFSAWWTSDRAADARERSWLTALVAARRLKLGTEVIVRWEQTMEAIGEDGATALGFTLLDILEQRHGRDQAVALARAVLAKPSVSNVFTWLTRGDAAVHERFAAITGERFDSFVEYWRAELWRRAAAGPLAERLRSLPEDRARLRVEPSRLGVDIVYTLAGPKLDRARECVVLYQKLRPYDRYVSSPELQRRKVTWSANSERAEGRLRGLFQATDRALLAVECDAPELRADVRLAAQRWTRQ